MSISNPPNILVYIAHDTGRFISPYGIATVRTPHAERFAREGILFENCFCCAPQCSPARAALFTGRYPHCNGVMGLTHGRFGWDLKEGEIHLAERLKRMGYATAVMGTTHETRNDPATRKRIGFDFDAGWPFPLAEAPARLEEFFSGLDAHTPFYVQIGTAVNHRPFDHDGAVPDDSLGLTIPSYLKDTPATRKDVAAMQGSIKRWDEGLGEVLEVLDRKGLTDSTLVIVTTDHGLAMPRAKMTLYDGGIGVLLMMRWPGGPLQAGKRYGELVSHVDILPSLLEMLGAEVDPAVQGQSFWPLLLGEDYQPRKEIFAEMTFHTYYDPMRCVRTLRYKYIRHFEMGPGVQVDGRTLEAGYVEQLDNFLIPAWHPYEELYDVQADPNEMNNLADDEAFDEIRAQLRRTLADWMRRTEDPLLKGPVASPFWRKSIEGLLR